MIKLFTQIEFQEASSRSKLALQCRECGRAFYKTKNCIQSIIKGNASYTGDFCGTKCSSKNNHNSPETVICANCNKSFLKFPSQIKRSSNHFCSRSCAATYNNKLFPKRMVADVFCKCGKKIRPKEKCCDTFVPKKRQRRWRKNSETSEMTLYELQNKISAKGKHPSWKNALVRNHARTHNRHLKGLPCQKCGYSLHSEFAHVKDITAFSLDSKLSEINDESNILILCRNCHWEFDHDFLLLDNIPNRLQQKDGVPAPDQTGNL